MSPLHRARKYRHITIAERIETPHSWREGVSDPHVRVWSSDGEARVFGEDTHTCTTPESATSLAGTGQREANARQTRGFRAGTYASRVCLAFASRIGARQTRGCRVGPCEVGVQVPGTCTTTYTKASRLPRAFLARTYTTTSCLPRADARGKREANARGIRTCTKSWRLPRVCLPRADLYRRPDVALSGVCNLRAFGHRVSHVVNRD